MQELLHLEEQDAETLHEGHVQPPKRKNLSDMFSS